MKEMLTSHEEEKGRFCNDITQCATISLPEEKVFMVAGYPPCRNDFETFVFKR